MADVVEAVGKSKGIKKAKLHIPLKGRHQYVVGIDFGHGETSAAICAIEWDKQAGQREGYVEDADVDVKARKKVIPSAICRVGDQISIGEEAFEHMTDNSGIRVCFKQKPESLEGEAEKLMIAYMEAVYNQIREGRQELTDTNHVVYIARPSGWVEEEAKELYRQMALKAGIPLAGLTSESRAAIFYAKSPRVNFSNEISRGAIVFDLGSSTLDFTHLSDDDAPVDFGYNLGASLIDRAIFEKLIKPNSEVQEFLTAFPKYEDALLYKARKFKEDAYGRSETSKTVGSFTLGSILSDEEESAEEYEGTFIKLKINNLAELNSLIEEYSQYQDSLAQALKDFKQTKIPNKKINGVFLTGGASRMNFIRPLIAKALDISEDKIKIDGDNPSLTISRGIAMLGAAEAITKSLVVELDKITAGVFKDSTAINKLITALAESISKEAWWQVRNTCTQWVKSGSDTDEEELKKWLERDLKSFQKNKLPKVIESTLQSFLKNENETIRVKMNEIISIYAPGQEITLTGKMSVDEISAINKSMEFLNETVANTCDSITNVVSNVLWAALGVFLFGLFSVAYYVVKGVINFFKDDDDIRREKTKKVLDKQDEIKYEVKTKIETELKGNKSFQSTVSAALTRYFMNVIDTNLKRVTIPIE